MGVRSTADYQGQLRQLLPPGPAWDPELCPFVDIVVRGLAPGFARVDARIADLLSEMFPGTVRELLPDWERVMGLPDACSAGSSGFGERLQEVVRRFVEAGRQDAPYFEEVARRLGYPDAKVSDWRAPRFGGARCGRARFGSWSAQFVWVMRPGSRKAGGSRFGYSVFSDRFGANPNDILECVIRRYSPAHTTVIFDWSE